MKSKKQKFNSDILAELETTQENTNFWKVVNSANGEFTENKIPPIPEEEWINRFKSLHSKKRTTAKQTKIADELSQAEKIPTSS